MLIPLKMFDDFVLFAETTFDVAMLKRTEEQIERTGEYARFLVGESLYVIRKPDDTRGTMFEVHTSDARALDRLEKSWSLCLAEFIEGMDDGGNSNGTKAENGIEAE